MVGVDAEQGGKGTEGTPQRWLFPDLRHTAATTELEASPQFRTTWTLK